jgi:(p)ppGpp synthase/HD superfamily hydrolase
MSAHRPAPREAREDPGAEAVAGGLLPRSVAYAAALHAGDARPAGGPLFAHLLGTAALALDHGADEATAAAAVLHDAAERHGGQARIADIEARFGPRVARVVRGCTDHLGPGKPGWAARKREHLARLAREPGEVLLVVLADKLDGSRALLAALRARGPALWAAAKHGPEERLAHLRAFVARAGSLVAERRMDQAAALVRELDEVVAALERLQPPPTPAAAGRSGRRRR